VGNLLLILKKEWAVPRIYIGSGRYKDIEMLVLVFSRATVSTETSVRLV
jgi:hypothetical protein